MNITNINTAGINGMTLPLKRNSEVKKTAALKTSEHTRSETDITALRNVSDDLRDMYVFSAYDQDSSYKARGSAEYSAEMNTAKKNGALTIMLGSGEALKFMNDIEKATAEGRSLDDILKSQREKHSRTINAYKYDSLFIDPVTGEVIESHAASRAFSCSMSDSVDKPTCKAVADDIAAFIRYTVFPKEMDDHEKVSRLLSEIKAKQSVYDTTRFDETFDWRLEEILKKQQEEADKEAATPDTDMTDDLLKMIRYIQEKEKSGVSAIPSADIMRALFGDKSETEHEKERIADTREKMRADFGSRIQL